jgi:hypothetical protein
MSIASTRAHDNPLHIFLQKHVYTKLLPDLLWHDIRYIVDVADATGLKLRSHLGQHGSPPWWSAISRELTIDNTSNLAHPVSPASNPIVVHTTHRIGDVVLLPKELCTGGADNYMSGGFAPTSEGYFYKVVAHTTDRLGRNGRTCFTLRHLTPLKGKPKMTADHIDDTSHRVTGYTAAPTLDKTAGTESEVSVDLLTVPYRTQRIMCKYTPNHRFWEHWRCTNNTDKFRTAYFITPNDCHIIDI